MRCHRWVRSQAPRVRTGLPALVDRWQRGEDVVSLARGVRYPPFLFARLLVEKVCGVTGKQVGELARNPERIEDPRLRAAVERAMEADPDCAPPSDIVREVIGREYEVLLQRCVMQLGVPFDTEDDLAVLGHAKTPDMWLKIPMAVRDERSGQWRHVCWIDSKAMFGDPCTFEDGHRAQFESYIHRYGPGLVVYWFGFVGTLPQVDGIAIASRFPEEFLLPGLKAGEPIRAEDTERGNVKEEN